MSKSFVIVALVVSMLSAGLPSMQPRALAQAGPYLFVFTCVGFQLNTRSGSPHQEAVVSVHSFDSDDANLIVRWGEYAGGTVKTVNAVLLPNGTFPFRLRNDETVSVGGTNFFIVQVFSTTENLVIDAENIYDGDSHSGAIHRRHVSCAPSGSGPTRRGGNR